MGLLDTIKPAERSYFLGLLADGLQGFNEWAQKPTQTQQMQGLPEMLGLLGTQRTLNRLSYGDPITNIGKANVPMIPQDTFDAAMLVGGLADPAAKALNAGAAAVGKRIAPAVERAVPAIMNRGGLPAQLMQDMSQGTQSPMIVWHGSPHKFDKFDASKIGTGEGAQAYGHGIYTAESPSVAKEYSKLDPAGGQIPSPVRIINGQEVQPGTGAYKAASLLDSMSVAQARKTVNGWLQGARPEEQAYFKEVADTLAAIPSKAAVKQKAPGGNLYKVDLPDEHIAKMLDWDKPLSQQHPDVQSALSKLDDPIIDTWKNNGFWEHAPKGGASVYSRLAGNGITKGNVESGVTATASEKLRSLGIPGIRYLDGGSRGTGAGTSNFVIFPGNEGLLSILERNGQALP